MIRKRGEVALFLVFFMFLFSEFVLAGNYQRDFYATSAEDRTGATYNLNPTDLAGINESDDVYYRSYAYWPWSFSDNEYIDFYFSPNISSNAIINSVVLAFEVKRDQNVSSNAKFKVFGDGAGERTEDINIPSADIDTTITEEFSYINTAEEANNFRFQFLAFIIGGGEAVYTYHDLVKLTVNYSLDEEAPDTNVTYFTKNDFSDQRKCENGKAYVNFSSNDITAHFNSSDEKSNLKDAEYSLDGGTSWYKGQGFITDYAKYDDDWYTLNTLNWENETYNVCGRAIDMLNNQESAKCCVLCIDVQKPIIATLTLKNPSECDNNYINENPTWNWSAFDPGCAGGISYYNIEVYEDEVNILNTTTSSNEYTYSSATNNKSYQVKIRAVDTIGNAGDWNSSEIIYIDKGNPSVTINSPQENSWFNSDFYLNETDTDTEDNLWKCYYKIRNNTGEWTTEGGNTYTLEASCNELLLINITKYCIGDENCTIYKRAKDKACNVNPTTSRNFIIDRINPVTNKTVNEDKYGNNDYYVNSSTKFNLTCSDGGIGCDKTYYKIDNGSWTEYIEQFNLSGYDEGEHTIYYYSNDSQGNIEEEKSQIHYLDNSAPNTTKTFFGNYTNSSGEVFLKNSSQINLSCSDSGSGVKYINYSKDNGTTWTSVESYETIFNITGEDGAYTIKYYCVDNINNQEDMKEETDYLDNSAPNTTKTISGPKYGAEDYYVTNETYFNLTCSDGASGCKKIYYKIDDGAYAEYTTLFTLVGYSEGIHSIYYYSEDNLGNGEEAHNQTHYLDITAPNTTKTFSGPGYQDNYYVALTTKFNLTCSDAGVGAKFINYSKDNGFTWTKADGEEVVFSITEGDGNYTIKYYCADNFEYAEQEKSQIHYLDNSAPNTTKTISGTTYQDNYYITSETKFNLTCSDSDSGVKFINYSTDNGTTWTKIDGGEIVFNVTGTEGNRTIKYYCEDNVDNVEQEKNQTHYLDNTGPSISLINPFTNENITCQRSVSGRITETDGVGIDATTIKAEWINSTGEVVVWNYLNYTNNNVYSKLFRVEDLMITAGDYNVKITAKDILGNEKTNQTNVNVTENICVLEIKNSTCEINRTIGGNCNFGYEIMSRGGNAVQMSMDPYQGISPYDLNATIFNENGIKYVEQNPEYSELLKIGNESITYGSFTFQFSFGPNEWISDGELSTYLKSGNV